MKRDIKDNHLGLAFIKDLKPVTYSFINDATHIKHDGFIAQDVEATMQKLNVQFSGLNKPKTDTAYYSLSYATFVVPLVNAVKELEVENQKLKREIDQLKTAVKPQNRDASKIEIGTMRVNVQSRKIEYFNGSEWVFL